MAAPTVTPTASAEKFDMPPYVFALAVGVPWVAGTAWMLQWDMSVSDALFGGLLVTIAVAAAFLLLAPVLVFLVVPALTALATVAQAPLVVAAVVLQAVATGIMSGLRSAAAARRAVDPAHE